MQHTSLRFSVRGKRAEQDISSIFTANGAEDFPMKSGTEAGPETDLYHLLKEAAQQYDHRIVFMRSNWLAVDKKIIKPGTWSAGGVFVADTDQVAGHGHDSAFCFGGFEHSTPGVGDISEAVAHYPTKGRLPGDPNHDVNRKYAMDLWAYLRKAGKGPDLAFVAGDFNMKDTDPRQDWAFGKGWTSAADETGDHENTGHGPIDGFGSLNSDGRVSAKWFNVLNDGELFMHSDHLACRVAWNVKLLKAG